MDAPNCGTQFRDPVCRIFKFYVKLSAFKDLYDNRAIHLIVLGIYFILLDQCHDSFSKYFSNPDIHQQRSECEENVLGRNLDNTTEL